MDTKAIDKLLNTDRLPDDKNHNIAHWKDAPTYGDVTAASAELAALLADRAKLREALEPLARYALVWEGFDGDYKLGNGDTTVKDLRRAARVLKETE